MFCDFCLFCFYDFNFNKKIVDMSFESTIESKNYGVNARKPVSVDEIEEIAYAAIGDLEKLGMGVRVAYFLHNNYYEKGAPFLAIGESEGLIRKFEQQRRSDDVSYGSVYIEKDKEQNRNIIYFEHVLKQGLLGSYADWEKVLKTLEVWLKAECRFVIEEDDFDEDDNAPKTPSKVRAEQAKKAKKEPSVPKNVKEVMDTFEYLVSVFEDMSMVQNDPHNFVQLYKVVLIEQEKLKTLTKKEQNQLKEVAMNFEEFRKHIVSHLGHSKTIAKEIKQILSLLDEYQKDFDYGKKVELLVGVGHVEMVANYVDDFEVLEQMAELKQLLDNSFVGSL
jgi:hypothetical protein